MSITTHPPRTRLRRPKPDELRAALAIVRGHKIDWWNPWPDEVADNTVRYLRKHGLVESWECEGAIQTSGNNFGHSWVEDVITTAGLALLEPSR